MIHNNPPCWTKHRSDEMFYILKCVQWYTMPLLFFWGGTLPPPSPVWDGRRCPGSALVISSQLDMSGRRPNQVLEPPYLFPSDVEDSGSALSASWTSELVILSARMSPDTLQRKTARACDLIVGVERLSHVDWVQSFLPDVFTHDGGSLYPSGVWE